MNDDIKRQFQEQIELTRKEATEATLKRVVEAVEKVENDPHITDLDSIQFEQARQSILKAIGGLNER